MILLPSTKGPSPRTDSLPFTYSSVEVGVEQRVHFEGLPWEREIAPSLILVSTNNPLGSVRISIDGQLILTRRLETPVSALRLGNLTVGGHVLSVTADCPVSAYVNFLGSAPNAGYLQRFCVAASSDVLHFRYVKREAGTEALVLRVFSPIMADSRPFQVRLRFKPSVPAGSGPFPEITLLEREAWITPGASGQTFLVAAAPAQLDDGQPVFLTLGADVPPGEHEIEIALSASSPRWLSLSRTTPGLTEKLEVTASRVVY